MHAQPAAPRLWTAHGPARRAGASGGLDASWPLAAARFASMLYLFVIAFLLLSALIPMAVGRWQPLSVVSGSMQPAIRPGSVVMVEPAAPDRFYANPSIVAFRDPARPGRIVTHRVVDTATDPSGVVSYTTRGDANAVADSGTVAHDRVVGAVRMVVPHLGLPSLWRHQGDLTRLAGVAFATLVALAALFARVRS